MRARKTLTLLLGLASAGCCGARELLILAGDNIPPYALPEHDSGAEVELLRAAFATQGITLRFRYVPLRRVSTDLELLQADGTTRGSATAGHALSQPYIRYQACVLGLSEGPNGTQLGQLGWLRVQAFQGARAELGTEFAAAVRDNPRYSEVNNQRNQLQLLRLGRIDLVVADRQIAAWHWQQLGDARELRCWLPLRSTDYRAQFRRAEDAQAFDAGLRLLRDSGEYQRLLARFGVPGVD